MNLFEDVVLQAEYVFDDDDRDGLTPAGIVWQYTPTGELYEAGTVVLVNEGDGRFHGDIYVHGAVYEILPTDTPPLHVVVERPSEPALACATPSGAPEADWFAGAMEAAAAPPPVELKDNIIRVLVVQSRESSYADKVGSVSFFGHELGLLLRQNVDSKISSAFRRARLALHQSGTAARIVSVAVPALKLDYSEKPFLSQDLDRLIYSDLDGHIACLRSQYKADVVFLWRRSQDPATSSSPACGIARQNYGYHNPDVAFAVGAHTCFERVFSHELGHLLSAQHDFIEEGPTHGHLLGERAFGYFAAFRNGGLFEQTGVGMNTLMAYASSCREAGFSGCVGLNYFSTPNKTVNGSQIGEHAGTYSAPGADNVTAINSMWRKVANYQQ